MRGNPVYEKCVFVSNILIPGACRSNLVDSIQLEERIFSLVIVWVRAASMLFNAALNVGSTETSTTVLNACLGIELQTQSENQQRQKILSDVFDVSKNNVSSSPVQKFIK